MNFFENSIILPCFVNRETLKQTNNKGSNISIAAFTIYLLILFYYSHSIVAGGLELMS